MARMNLKLKIPVTDFDFDVDENSLESNGWVRIVRCKDCKHCDPEDKGCDCAGHEMLMGGIIPMPDDWFCANGEREAQDGE